MPSSRKSVGRRFAVPVSESYLFRIDQIEPHYSFGTNEGHRDPNGYSEYHHTEIDTLCLSPAKLDGRQTRFTLIADRKLASAMSNLAGFDRTPTGIGTLTMRGQRSEYLGSLPFDAALNIPGLVVAGAYRFIYLAGEPLGRGSAVIRYMAFYREYDVADL